MNVLKKGLSLQKIVLAYLPPLLWATVIFIFSAQASLPGFEESAYDFFLKKSAHVFVYLVLYTLVFHAVQSTVREEYKKTILLLPIAICLLYAVSDELHQSLVPGRYATLRDIGYDMLGVMLAFLKKYDYI